MDLFNLGNSHPVKPNELVDLLESITGKKAIREFESAQPGDVPLTWADVSNAGRLLGYHPSKLLEKGLQEFVAWFRATNLAQRT